MKNITICECEGGYTLTVHQMMDDSGYMNQALAAQAAYQPPRQIVVAGNKHALIEKLATLL